MVSTLSVWFIGITLILTVIAPLVLITTLLIQRKISFVPVLTGSLVFIIFQILTRIPLISAMATSTSFRWLFENAIISSLFLGFTAGIFEEFGRFLGCKTLMRNRLEWRDGLALGLGAGATESILIVGVNALNNLFYAYSINNGRFEEIAAAVPQDVAAQLYDTMTKSAPILFLMSGIERVFAITIQVALSILIVYAVRKKKFSYVLIAVAAHFVIDSPLGLLSPLGIFIAEAYVLICAIAALVYIIKSKKLFDTLKM